MQETALCISLGTHFSQEIGGKGGTPLSLSAISPRSQKSVNVFVVLYLG